MYGTIIFDMDGTLFNSEAFARNAINTTIRKLKYLGLKEVTEEQTRKALGKPMMEYYKTLFPGISNKQIEEAIDVCKQVEKEIMFSGEGGALFDGTLEILETIYKRGITLALATNSSSSYMMNILKKFKIDKYFTYTLCAETNGGMTKTEMLKEIISLTSKPHLMIGDRVFDLYAAQRNDIDFIACDYGYSDIPDGESNIVARVTKLLDIKEYVFNN